MATRYGTAASVKTRTGVSAEDIGLDSDDELDTFLDGLLDETTDLMDRSMRTSLLTPDPVPAGLNAIANDIAADSLRTMVATRQTPVVRIDDFAIRTITTRVLSADVKERLALYSGSAGGTAANHELSNGDIADTYHWHFTLADLDAETP